MKHEKSVTYKGWVVSRLTSRQNNIIQDEMVVFSSQKCCQPHRDSCDKFQKFGAVVHLLGKVNSLEQKQLQ